MLGFDSGAALAAVVGVPVAAPVMRSVVAIVNRAKERYAYRDLRDVLKSSAGLP
jgi:ACR3 family arsenite efflux pump ArsB